MKWAFWQQNADARFAAHEQSGDAIFDDEEQPEDMDDDEGATDLDLLTRTLTWMQTAEFTVGDLRTMEDGMGIVMAVRERLGFQNHNDATLLGRMNRKQIKRDLADVASLYELQ